MILFVRNAAESSRVVLLQPRHCRLQVFDKLELLLGDFTFLSDFHPELGVVRESLSLGLRD